MTMQWNIQKSLKTLPWKEEMNFFPQNFDAMFIDKMEECSKYMFTCIIQILILETFYLKISDIKIKS